MPLPTGCLSGAEVAGLCWGRLPTASDSLVLLTLGYGTAVWSCPLPSLGVDARLSLRCRGEKVASQSECREGETDCPHGSGQLQSDTYRINDALNCERTQKTVCQLSRNTFQRNSCRGQPHLLSHGV